MGGGYRDSHGALAVVLFPHLSAILSRHAYGMLALLGKAGVINDPRQHRPLTLHFWQGIIPNCLHHRDITPRCLGHKMMQGLVFGTHLARSKLRRHGFDTLSLNRQQQARAIRLKRFHPVCMTQRGGQLFRIRTKPGLDIG